MTFKIGDYFYKVRRTRDGNRILKYYIADNVDNNIITLSPVKKFPSTIDGYLNIHLIDSLSDYYIFVFTDTDDSSGKD